MMAETFILKRSYLLSNKMLRRKNKLMKLFL